MTEFRFRKLIPVSHADYLEENPLFVDTALHIDRVDAAMAKAAQDRANRLANPGRR